MIPETQIRAAIPHALLQTEFTHLGERYKGKVRDNYLQPGRRILITSDRISALTL